MKKLFLIAPVALMALASCNNDESEPISNEEAYARGFIKEFGHIDPSHTWGFTLDDNARSRAESLGTNILSPNQWRDKWWAPNDVTADEVKYVMAYAAHNYDTGVPAPYMIEKYGVEAELAVTYRISNRKTIDVSPNFFVTHIGSSKQTNGGNGDYNKMDELAIMHDWDKSQLGFDDGYEHIADYKASNTVDNSGHMLFTCMSAEDWAASSQTERDDYGKRFNAHKFAYHNALDNNYYNNYIVVSGDDVEKWCGKNLGISDNYYVCFDYVCTTADKVVQSDRIYDDWVVRIAGNAIPRTESPTIWKRVFVESLALHAVRDIKLENCDWDFNDIVFDVSIDRQIVNTGATLADSKYQTEGKATVILQALGCTLPVYLGKDEDHLTPELHGFFGYNSSIMVNTDLGVRHDPVDISEYLKDESGYWMFNNEDYRSLKVYAYLDGEYQQLTAETGEPTSMFAGRLRDEWPKEQQHVVLKYPSFTKWIGDRTYDFWLKLTGVPSYGDQYPENWDPTVTPSN